MKMLIVFEKTGAQRFIGHLDLQRAMQRALRRAGLQVKFSQGFNPHMLISFAAPLSVGVEGENELMDVQLPNELGEQDLSPADYLAKLRAALPEGLKAHKAILQQDSEPAAMAQLYASSYRIDFLEDGRALMDALPSFLAKNELPFIRRGKAGERQSDYRPLILALKARENSLYATLMQNEKLGTGRPDQLLSLLAGQAQVPVPRVRITRLALLDSDLKAIHER